MKRLLSWFVAGCATFATVTPALVGAMASPAGAANPGAEGQFLSLLNGSRAQAGLAPLADDAGLTSIARTWTDHLAAAGTLSHNPSLAVEVPSDWLRYGENVGMGGDVPSIETAFMNSPEHRANILGDYNTVGIGVDVTPAGEMFVTVDFLKVPNAVAAAAAPTCTNSNPPSAPSASAARGYYVLGNDGGI